MILVLLCKWAAIAALIAEGRMTSLIWIPVLARTQLLLVFLHTPYARAQGLGAELTAHLPRRLSWATVLFIPLGSLLQLRGEALPLLVVTGLVYLYWRRAMMVRLGGFTGDTAGALVELSEAAILVTAALLP